MECCGGIEQRKGCDDLFEHYDADGECPGSDTYAAYRGHLDCLKTLYKEDNRYVLSAACLGGHLECVKYLVEERGAKIDRNCAVACVDTDTDLKCLKYLVEKAGTGIVTQHVISMAISHDYLIGLKYLVGYLELPISMHVVRGAVYQQRYKHLEWLAYRGKIKYVHNTTTDEIQLVVAEPQHHGNPMTS